MEKRGFLKSLCAGLAVASLPAFPSSRTIGESSAQPDDCALTGGEIQHMVIFSVNNYRLEGGSFLGMSITNRLSSCIGSPSCSSMYA